MPANEVIDVKEKTTQPLIFLKKDKGSLPQGPSSSGAGSSRVDDFSHFTPSLLALCIGPFLKTATAYAEIQKLYGDQLKDQLTMMQESAVSVSDSEIQIGKDQYQQELNKACGGIAGGGLQTLTGGASVFSEKFNSSEIKSLEQEKLGAQNYQTALESRQGKLDLVNVRASDISPGEEGSAKEGVTYLEDGTEVQRQNVDHDAFKKRLREIEDHKQLGVNKTTGKALNGPEDVSEVSYTIGTGEDARTGKLTDKEVIDLANREERESLREKIGKQIELKTTAHQNAIAKANNRSQAFATVGNGLGALIQSSVSAGSAQFDEKIGKDNADKTLVQTAKDTVGTTLQQTEGEMSGAAREIKTSIDAAGSISQIQYRG